MTDENSDKNKPNSSVNPDKNYDIGYGKPPRHSQFRPGQSGNPKGRPRGSKSFGTYLEELLKSRIAIKDERGQRMVTRREGMAMRLAELALKGDQKALQVVLSLEAKQTDTHVDLSGSPLSETEQMIFDAFLNDYCGDGPASQATNETMSEDPEKDHSQEAGTSASDVGDPPDAAVTKRDK